MGQTISSFTKGTEHSENDNKEETIEQLQLIQQMLATKIETETNKMRVAAIEDKRFPVATVVGTSEKHLIATERATVAEIKKCLSEAFRTKFLGGLVKMALTDVNGLLEKTSEGEAETMTSHVVIANNSVLRIDYYLYKYTFCSKDLRDEFKNTVCYAVQLGVLDLEKADLELVIQGLEKTIPNLEYRKQRQNFQQELLHMRDLYREITRLQFVFGGKEKKSNAAWEIVLRSFVDFCENRQTQRKGFKSLRKIDMCGHADEETFISETEYHMDKYLSKGKACWPGLAVSVPQKIQGEKERERKKRKENVRRKRERDKKVAWRTEDD